MSEPSAENQPTKSSGIPLGVWSGSDATERLRQTMLDVDRSSRRQGTIMIWLTGVLVLMTGVLVWLTIVLVRAE
jgi:hypothetical protein